MYSITDKTSKFNKRNTYYLSSLLLLSLYYLSYRYPFQINSSTTSPTYADTPLVLQLAKYLIFASILYLTALLALKVKERPLIRSSQAVELALYVYIFIVSLLAAYLGKSDYMAQTGLFFCSLVLVYIVPIEINGKVISRIIHWFLYLSILVDAYQIFMYYTKGRLPALAYEGSVNIRFGSIWDDPNGFALILAFLLPFYWVAKHRTISKIMISIAIFIMLGFTLSMTGAASVVGSLIAGTALIQLHQKNTSGLFKMGAAMALAIITLFAGYKLFLEDLPFVQQFLFEKQGSIELHMNYAAQLEMSHLMQIVSMTPVGKFSESGYINMIVNFGTIYLMFYVIVGLLTIRRLLRIIKDNKNTPYKEIYYGALYFVIAFLIGMSNIPYDVVFPLNLIFVVCIMLSYVDQKNKSAIKSGPR